MHERTLKRGPSAPLAVVRALAAAVFAWALAAAAPAGAAPPSPAPPSPSEYTTSALCSLPAPGYSGCLGLRLFAHRPLAHPGARAVAPSAPAGGAQAETSSALVEGVPPGAAVERTTPVEGSLAPSDVLGAYGLNGATPPTPQTIAIVDAYDAPTLASDLPRAAKPMDAFARSTSAAGARRCRPPAAPKNAAGHRRSLPTSSSRTASVPRVGSCSSRRNRTRTAACMRPS